MKILINAANARLGGGQTYLVNLLRHIPDRSDLELLVYAPESLDIPHHGAVRRMKSCWPLDNPLLRTLWERFVLPGILRHERIDLLYCPGGVVATTPPAGCKVATMFRNMMPFDAAVVARLPWGTQRLRNLLLRRVMLRSLANADLAIFISDHARSVIEGLTDIRNPITIPHGIAPAFRTDGRPLPRPEGIPEGEYLLYVSRFDVYKHHYEVVSAYAALPATLRRRYRLLLVGETNLPEAARIRRLVERLQLGDRVHFLGALPYNNLPALYRHASLNLFASSCENCPNILLEALGAGRPVLSSNVMPMPEFGGDAVGYFSPYDPDDICRAIEEVLCNEALGERMAAAAVERAGQFDWQRTAQKTWSGLLGLCEDGGPRPPLRA